MGVAANHVREAGLLFEPATCPVPKIIAAGGNLVLRLHPVPGSRDPARQRHPELRMKCPKRQHCRPAANDRFQEPVFQIAFADAIAMRHERGAPRELYPDWIRMKVDPHLLLKEAAAPGVVVSTHHCDRHSGFDQIGQGGQHAKVLSGYDGAVLEPEVEEVTRQEKGTSVGTHVFKKAQEPPFRSGGDATQMDVGDNEICSHAATNVRDCHPTANMSAEERERLPE